MTEYELFTLFLLAGVAGVMNSIAGGGTFVTFPTMVFFGMPPLIANTTSTVALWPGSISGAYGFRGHLKLHTRSALTRYVVVSLAGGLTGAVLLVLTPPETFQQLVPWFLLVATALFAASGKITAYARSHPLAEKIPGGFVFAFSLAAQFAVAIYGGYFGAGIGIMMLALFSLSGMKDINAINALKTLLATSVNSVAVITFVVSGLVDWQVAAAMLAGSIPAGYFGAKAATKLSPATARKIIISIGSVITLAFFVKYY